LDGGLTRQVEDPVEVGAVSEDLRAYAVEHVPRTL